jgi:arginine deiminase
MPLQLNKKEQFFPERGVINGKLKESNKRKQESILRFIFKTLKGIKSAFNYVTHFQLKFRKQCGASQTCIIDGKTLKWIHRWLCML